MFPPTEIYYRRKSLWLCRSTATAFVLNTSTHRSGTATNDGCRDRTIVRRCPPNMYRARIDTFDQSDVLTRHDHREVSDSHSRGETDRSHVGRGSPGVCCDLYGLLLFQINIVVRVPSSLLFFYSCTTEVQSHDASQHRHHKSPLFVIRAKSSAVSCCFLTIMLEY